MLTIPSIPSFDSNTAEAARKRHDNLTKPSGSLGRLEELSIQLAGIYGQANPHIHQKSVIVMAADHGVARTGVSAYPPEVTAQMVMNFLHGGAAINVLARQAGASVVVVDIGVDYEFEAMPGLIRRKIARGTNNMLEQAAMSRCQAEEAIHIGIEVALEEAKNGVNLIATGDMGIGNTTPSSAITAAFTALPVSQCTGRGTGLDDKGLKNKIQTIEKSLQANQPDASDPLDVLSKVGGFDIAGIAGVIIGAAACRIPVLIDGFISGAAALVAAELVPAVKPYLIASHQSVEIGHTAILERLAMKPLLDLGMRLGEGTGAILAAHLIEAAVLILNEMATFDEAGVSSNG